MGDWLYLTHLHVLVEKLGFHFLFFPVLEEGGFLYGFWDGVMGDLVNPVKRCC